MTAILEVVQREDPEALSGISEVFCVEWNRFPAKYSTDLKTNFLLTSSRAIMPNIWITKYRWSTVRTSRSWRFSRFNRQIISFRSTTNFSLRCPSSLRSQKEAEKTLLKWRMSLWLWASSRPSLLRLRKPLGNRPLQHFRINCPLIPTTYPGTRLTTRVLPVLRPSISETALCNPPRFITISWTMAVRGLRHPLPKSCSPRIRWLCSQIIKSLRKFKMRSRVLRTKIAGLQFFSRTMHVLLSPQSLSNPLWTAQKKSHPRNPMAGATRSPILVQIRR